ncbi:hypothetical protein BOX15_Mlig009325g1, partial [Macrostomum lignano]
ELVKRYSFSASSSYNNSTVAQTTMKQQQQQKKSPKDEADQTLDLVCLLDAHLRASGLKREVSRYIVSELNNCSELKARIHEQTKLRMQMLDVESDSAAERNHLVRDIFEAVRPLVPDRIQLHAAEMVKPAATELLKKRRLRAETGLQRVIDQRLSSTRSNSFPEF